MNKNNELRILKNFLYCMPKIYARRNANYCIVRDILMQGTSTAGMTSCIAKCRELGIDPYGYNLEPEKDDGRTYQRDCERTGY